MLVDYIDAGGDLLSVEMPVRLQVAGVELLVSCSTDPGAPPKPGLPLLLPQFAVGPLNALRFAWYVGSASMPLNEYGVSLLIRVGGGRALLHPTQHVPGRSGHPGATVEVPFESLFAAWTEFARRVRETAIARNPSAVDWPEWRWIEDESDWLSVARFNVREMKAHAACFDRVDAFE